MRRFHSHVVILIAFIAGSASTVRAEIDPPPIFNDFTNQNVYVDTDTLSDCLESPPPLFDSGWSPAPPPCAGSQSGGKWPIFSQLFYRDTAIGPCAQFNFRDLPLTGLGEQSDLLLGDGSDHLIPSYHVGLFSLDALTQIRPVSLECSPDRFPVEASARYAIQLYGSDSNAECSGAVFFITAEFNPALFNVRVFGDIRNPGSSLYECSSAPLQPFAPRLMVGREVITPNTLRYNDLIANPQFVSVSLKPGRSVFDVGGQSVRLRVHSFNWGANSGGCGPFSSCLERMRFQLDDQVTINVLSADLPDDWCPPAPELDVEDRLPISTISNDQRRSAEFEAVGVRLMNELKVELPSLRSGHCRMQVGRSLAETLNNTAVWHTEFQCNGFVRFNAHGTWVATDDLPLHEYADMAAGSSLELNVDDHCQGFRFAYRNPNGQPQTGERLELDRVERLAGGVVRTFIYDDQAAPHKRLIAQVDDHGNMITYEYAEVGGILRLTATATDTFGATRQIIADFSNCVGDGVESDYCALIAVKSASGGPARRYEYITTGGPAVAGRIAKVNDDAGNVLLRFEYDGKGRLLQTSRGSGSSFQILNCHVFVDPEPSGQFEVDDRGMTMLSRCYVGAGHAQATTRHFDKFNRLVAQRQWHNFAFIDVSASTCADVAAGTAYPAPESRTQWNYADLIGGGRAIAMDLPGGTATVYTLMDADGNLRRQFTADRGLLSSAGVLTEPAHSFDERTMNHALFAGVWQEVESTDLSLGTATARMEFDSVTGFMKRRTAPGVSADRSGSGTSIPPQDTYQFRASFDLRRVVREERLDGLGGPIVATIDHDDFSYPTTRTETATGVPPRVTASTYNAFGELIRETDADGYVTEHLYDDASHPNSGSGLLIGRHTYQSGISGPVLRQIVNYYYNSGRDRGRLRELRIADHVGPFTLGQPDAWQINTFEYDVFGRLTHKIVTHTAYPNVVNEWWYTYDYQDRLRQVTYPDGMWVRYERNGRGLLTHEHVGYGGDPEASNGGTVELTNRYDYDARGNLKSRINQTAAHLPDLSTYEYDRFGRRTERCDITAGTADYDIVTRWNHDGGDRVVRESVMQRDGVLDSMLSDMRWDYDQLGRDWRMRTLAEPETGANEQTDHIFTRAYDITGNEIASRLIDMAIGDAVVTTSYDPFDRLRTMSRVLTDTTSSITLYETDQRGNTTVEVSPIGHRTEREYDALGRVSETRRFEHIGSADELRLKSLTRYTSRDQRAEQVDLDVAGVPLDRRSWSYDAMSFESREARYADPASTSAALPYVDRVVDSEHDALGRLIERRTYVDGAARVTRWLYDAIGRLELINHPVFGNSEAWSYPSASVRPDRRTMTDEIGTRSRLFEYDAFGRMVVDRAEGTSPELDITTRFVHDALDRQVMTIDPLGTVHAEIFDGIGRLKESIEDFGGIDHRETQFTYTQKGDPLTVVADAADTQQTTVYQHDRGGRRIRVDHPAGGGVPASSILFAFDTDDRMTSRTAEDGFVTFYEHNWRDEVVRTRAGGASGAVLEEFAFDPLGRMTAAAVGPISTATFKTANVYGNGGDVDGDGVSDPAYCDEPVATLQTIGGTTRSVHYRWNTAIEMSRLVYPAAVGVSLDYSYNGFGLVAAINQNGSRLANFGYAGMQVTSRQVRTAATANEVWIETNWQRPDQLRRPAVIINSARHGSTNGAGGSVTERLRFTNVFDAANNLEHQTTVGSLAPDENGQLDHGYDRLYRLRTSDYPDGTSETWELDALGNRMFYSARDQSVTNYADNVLNQYTSIDGQPLQYDAKGNLARNERGYGFTYDHRNLLTRVFDDLNSNGDYDIGETVFADFVVDALGRRVQASINGTVTQRIFDIDNVLLAEFNAADPGVVDQYYINGPSYRDEKLLVVNAAGQHGYYLHKDLYTVAGLCDSQGGLIETYSYSGFGLPVVHRAECGSGCLRGDLTADLLIDGDDVQMFVDVLLGVDTDPQHLCAADMDCDGVVDAADAPLFEACALNLSCPTGGSGNGGLRNPFYFTGQRLDTLDPAGGPGGHVSFGGANLLLYDYKARAYDSLHGRFLQRDPSEFADTFNLYEYVRSRPTWGMDPTGKFTLGSLLSGSNIQKAFNALGKVQTAQDALHVARQLATGASIQGIVVTLTIEYATDKFGGKLFDKALDALSILKKRFSKGIFRGRKGGPHHRATVAAESDRLASQGYGVASEGHFKTTGGDTTARFADVVAFNPKTGDLQIIQVGGVTQSTGVPIGREMDALNDIMFNSALGANLAKRLEGYGLNGIGDVKSISFRFIEKIVD